MATLLKKIGVDSKYLEARQKAKEESKKQKEEEKKQKKLEKEEKKRRKAAKDALGSEPPVEGETASSLSDQPPPAKIEIDEFDDIDSDPPSEEEEDNTPAASRRSSRQVEAVASGARGPQTLLEKKYHVEALEKKVERLSTEQLQLESELARKEEEFKAQQEADRRQLEEERRLAHKQREEDKARRLAEEEAAKKAEQERLANLSGFLSKKGHVRHNWKTRWFQLDSNEGIVEYFEDERRLKKCGRLNLRGGATLQDAEHHERKQCFLVTEKGGKSFFLSAGTPKEFDEWKKAMISVIMKFFNADVSAASSTTGAST